MDPQDSPRFFQGLAAMAVMFCDDMSEPRQRLYWEALKDEMTIVEWEAACMQAIKQETFHKVPLPRVLLDYATKFREEQRRVRAVIAHAERIALEASPQWREQQAMQQIKEWQQQEKYAVWLKEQPKEKLYHMGLLNPPHPERWERLRDENLSYTPTEDPERAKERLRKQLQQLEKQEEPH